MNILKIKLENIKTYEDGPVIELHHGVNFISGKNGSGKTTLLESIGYGIFNNCNYSNISKMLREGTKNGKIIIWFSFKDGIIYRSERKITPSSNTWTVYEESDETEIVSGGKETLNWLKEKMGLSGEVNISQMYSDIIGVSQGEITTYFKLSSEAKRKEHFNPLIGVEDYKKAFSQTSSLPSNIKFQIQEIVSKIAEINARTEKYSENKEKLEKIKKDLEKIQKEVAEKDVKFKANQKKLKEKEELKDKLKEYEKRIGIMEENLRNKQDQKKKITKSVNNAKKAYKIVSKFQINYESYLKANEKFEEEDNKAKQKREFEERKNVLVSNKITIEKEIEVSDKNNKNQEKKIKNKIKQEEKKIKLINMDSKINYKKLEGIKRMISQIEEIRDENLEELNDMFISIKEKISTKRTNEIEIDKRKRKINSLKKDIKEVKDINNIRRQINELNKKISVIQGKEQIILDKIESHESNFDKGGLCPILNEPCNKISKSILNQKIKKLNTDLAKIRTEIRPLKKELKYYESEKERVIKLETKNTQIEEEIEEITNLQEENHELRHEIELPGINKIITKIKQNSKKLKISINFPLIKKEEEIGKKLDSLIRNAKKIINDKRKETDKIRTNEEKIKTSYETRIKKSNEGIEELKDDLLNLSISKNELKKREKEVNNIKNDLNRINEKIRPLLYVEKEIKNLKLIINKNKKGYENYQKNINESENLDSLYDQLKQISDYINKYNKVKISLDKKILILRGGFDEKNFNNLKEHVEKLREDKIKTESRLNEFERENKELIRIIKEMETELMKIKNLEEEKDKIEETSKIINLIRKILNDVGKPIAQRYLDSLSASANLIYNTLFDEKVILTWQSDYLIRLTDLKGTREFTQLSGGEQMCAALSVQLALAREFSSVGIAIFDEPTTNLDDDRRNFLSDTILNVKEEYGFNQLFIISHDETFSSLTEQEIHLEKINGKTSLA